MAQIDLFAANLSFGKLGEGIISKWLRRKGWNVLPAYEIEIATGKGPRLYTATVGELITPDMLAFRGDTIRWIEAKTKSSFTWYRHGMCWQDGIDRRHWEDYCSVADLNAWQVWLLFLHCSKRVAKDTPLGMAPPRGLFGQEISILRARIDHQSNRHAGGMVYWNIDVFHRLAQEDELAP